MKKKKIDVANIRSKFGCSQIMFASLLNISVKTLRDWEQGRRNPSGAAITLLTIVEKYPEIIYTFL